ncbi:TRAP transporter small permease [Neobacillus drentensis]|jgi:TRAP-type transport system small permease protein|uniref:TRAP transporter small permease n=1 Tax=Neobacillus drentensis TaxID=220684 RepID=UPI0030003D15
MENLLGKLRRITEYLVYIMLSVMTIIICYQVFSRFVLNVTPPWIQELSLLLMVWIGFLGIAVGIQDNSHIQINLFINALPERAKVWVGKFHRVLAILFGIFMVIQGGQFAHEMRTSTISGLNVPSAVLYYSVPVSGGLIVLYLVLELFGKWHPTIVDGEGDE